MRRLLAGGADYLVVKEAVVARVLSAVINPNVKMDLRVLAKASDCTIADVQAVLRNPDNIAQIQELARVTQLSLLTRCQERIGDALEEGVLKPTELTSIMNALTRGYATLAESAPKHDAGAAFKEFQEFLNAVSPSVPARERTADQAKELADGHRRDG